MIPLTFCAFAPLGKIIGNWLANGMIWLYGVTGFFGIALLAVLRPFLVMTGMHTAFTPYVLNAMATVGYEPFYSPACTVANLNQHLLSGGSHQEQAQRCEVTGCQQRIYSSHWRYHRACHVWYQPAV